MGTEPSKYELAAWADLHRVTRGSRGSRAMQGTSEYLHAATSAARVKAREVVDKHPRLRQARQSAVVAAGAARDRMPRPVTNAASRGATGGKKVIEGGTRALSRVATAGLSPKRVVKAHRKRGHPVVTLADVRSLDLELIDHVKPRWLDLCYEVAAAAVGAGSGLAITGGELLTGASGGAAAAPGLGTVAGAALADGAAVLTLSSAVVGHIGLHYGYDSARPEEKLFLLSVINLGTAATASSKMTAFADVSRLTPDPPLKCCGSGVP